MDRTAKHSLKPAALALASLAVVVLFTACSDPDTSAGDAAALTPDGARSPDGSSVADAATPAPDAAATDGTTGTGDAATDAPVPSADTAAPERSSVADAATADTRALSARPNILLIVADDLGYSDIGAFGGEISTPNLDTLAAEGRILTGHHSGSVCSPTRAMIASGTDSHLVGIGRQGGGTGVQVGKPGYEGFLNDKALSIAELLRDAGYHTYIAGKWHLGDTEDRSPKARGYQSSFVLLPGVATFFNEFSEPPTTEQQQLYRENGVFTVPPADFYATNFYTDKLISFLDADRDDDRPFFAFAAYTAPHWPLQAPPEYIDRYRGRYDAGYEAVRARRIERQKALGIIPAAFEPNPLLPATEGNPKTWAALTDDERKSEARRMEIYAAMVENLDANIGRLLRYLKVHDKYENTFIFFQSDNGAEGGDRDTFVDPSRSGPVDNSLLNLGRKGSYIGYGARWAEVSASPFRLWKSYSTEGGVAVPAIARLPKQHQASARFDGLTHVIDLAPTFLELAGATPPGATYKGKPVHPMTGLSLWPTLQERAATVRDPDQVLAWEHGNHRYVIRGNWKLVWLAAPYGPTPKAWTLHDLATDRGEIRDVSAAHPEIVQELTAAWDQYAARTGVVLLPTPAPPDAGTPSDPGDAATLGD